MLSLGYSAFAAVALPAIGYDALCTYALLGVPIVVFADVASGLTGTPLSPSEVGMYFAQFMPLVTTLISLSMLWLAGGWKELKAGWPVALTTGLTAGFIAIGMNIAGLPTLTGVVAGIGVVLVMLLFLKLSGKRIIDRDNVTPEEESLEKKMLIGLAVLPWILLVAFSVLTNFKTLGIYGILFKDWAMPVTIIPGKPQSLRMAWHAYTWVFIATLISIPFYRMSRRQLSEAMSKTWRRVPRPAFAAAIYFAVAYVLNNSGRMPGENGWTASPDGANMIGVVAHSCASAFQGAYAGIAGFLGLLGGFISGSETSSIVMLSRLHFETLAEIAPERMPEMALLVAAVSGIGGGLASVISPAKLQNAAAVIDRIGLEGKVIKSTIVLSLIMTALVSLASYAFLASI